MAETVLIVHFLVILFLVAGFPVALAFNHTGFRLFHAGVLAFVTLLVLLGVPCPLTLAEDKFRGEPYGDSFLAHWLTRIVYLQWFQPRHVFILDMVFAALVFSSFYWRPLKHRDEKKESSP